MFQILHGLQLKYRFGHITSSVQMTKGPFCAKDTLKHLTFLTNRKLDFLIIKCFSFASKYDLSKTNSSFVSRTTTLCLRKCGKSNWNYITDYELLLSRSLPKGRFSILQKRCLKIMALQLSSAENICFRSWIGLLLKYNFRWNPFHLHNN